MELDSTDQHILATLQQDGKTTMKELAASLKITTTPVYERVRRLQREGFIERYVAILNPEKIGRSLHVFIHISIIDHSHAGLSSFLQQVVNQEEVMECHHISGDADFILKIRVRNMADYNTFVTERLAQVPNIGRIRSSFSLSIPKSTTQMPVV